MGMEVVAFTEVRTRENIQGGNWKAWTADNCSVALAWKTTVQLTVKEHDEHTVRCQVGEYAVMAVYMPGRPRAPDFFTRLNKHLRGHAIVLGDFNADPVRNRYVRDKTMKNWLEQRRHRVTNFTAHIGETWRGSRGFTSQIDHIIGTTRCEAQAVRKLWTTASDHAAVALQLPTLEKRAASVFTNWKTVMMELKQTKWAVLQRSAHAIQSLQQLESFTHTLLTNAKTSLQAAQVEWKMDVKIKQLLKQVRAAPEGSKKEHLRNVLGQLLRKRVRPERQRIQLTLAEAIPIALKHIGTKPTLREEEFIQHEAPEDAPTVTFKNPTVSEVGHVLKAMRTTASAGPSGVGARFWRAVHTARPYLLCRWVKAVGMFGLPKAAKEVRAAFIPKKATFRMIGVQEHLAKLFTKFVAIRFTELRNWLPRCFITFRGPRPLLSSILNASAKDTVFKMDVAKAFDTVGWDQLRLALAPFLDEQEVEVLMTALTSYKLRYNTVPIKHQHGVLQGDPFSNIALALLFYRAFVGTEVLRWTNFFVYVDDVSGTGKTTHEALQRMQLVKQLLRKVGLSTSVLKEDVAQIEHAHFPILGFLIGGKQRVRWPPHLFHQWKKRLKQAPTWEALKVMVNVQLRPVMHYFGVAALAEWKRAFVQLDRLVADEFTRRMTQVLRTPTTQYKVIPYYVLTNGFGICMPSYAAFTAYRRWDDELKANVIPHFYELKQADCDTEAKWKALFCEKWKTRKIKQTFPEIHKICKQWNKGVLSYKTMCCAVGEQVF